MCNIAWLFFVFYLTLFFINFFVALYFYNIIKLIKI